MVRPKRHSRPGYGSPGESTHNRTATLSSNRRPINRRHANRRKSPMPDYPKPDYPTPTHRFSATSPRTSLALGKLPTRRRGLSYVSAGFSFLLRLRAGLPYIYTLEAYCLLTPDSAEYIGWPEQTGHTINFPYEITHLSFFGYTK